MSDIQAFEQAKQDVGTLTKRPSNDDLLYLYAHYKQGSVGDVQGKRPGMLDVKGRAMYDAWAKLKGVGQQDARQRYIAKVSALLASHR
ncbi:acyl-CoA-binding protein [Isoalcanivorax beigongshangi]|uniref:Acyl-CoA-binding protein n=1 Tax=Isoalcanivorax beigongshangi TaxID=3238810 RepID=A0ABV4AGK8_9GAMM